MAVSVRYVEMREQMSSRSTNERDPPFFEHYRCVSECRGKKCRVCWWHTMCILEISIQYVSIREKISSWSTNSRSIPFLVCAGGGNLGVERRGGRGRESGTMRQEKIVMTQCMFVVSNGTELGV